MSTNSNSNDHSRSLHRHRLRFLSDLDQQLAEAGAIRNVALLQGQWEIETRAESLVVQLRERLAELEWKVSGMRGNDGSESENI